MTTRLSVNLHPTTAEALKELADRKGITITDAVRRSVACWKFMEDTMTSGDRVAIIEVRNGHERIREIVWLST